MAEYLKKEDRKNQIKKAAIDLISKKGYRNTSVQDIVDKINYSKGGFYNCYSSKKALFEEIINDGMDNRFKKLKRYDEIKDKVDRKDFIIDALLDKMLDYNIYKKVYVSLVFEMNNSKDLLEIHRKYYEDMLREFINFCKKEGFEEYIKLSNEQFAIFINSIIIGADIYDAYVDDKYREMLKGMISAYFDKINLFE